MTVEDPAPGRDPHADADDLHVSVGDVDAERLSPGIDGDDGDGDDDDENDDDAPDLAQLLLARLRGDRSGAFAAGAGRRAAGSRRRRRPAVPGRSDRDQWSGARPDALDPVPVGSVLDGFVAARGWDDTLAQARVLADWASLVGPEVAQHCQPVSLTDGELRLAATSTAWATQLRLLAGTLQARLDDQIGHGVVRRISVSGPVAPSWRHGPRAVPGARGPRDTYG